MHADEFCVTESKREVCSTSERMTEFRLLRNKTNDLTNHNSGYFQNLIIPK